MALTARETALVKTLKAAGMSNNDIQTKIERLREVGKADATPSTLSKNGQRVIGIGKSIAETVRGGSALTERAFNTGIAGLNALIPGGAPFKQSGAGGLFSPKGEAAAEEVIPENWATPSNPEQAQGKFVGDVAQFLLPSAGVAGLSSKLATRLPTTLAKLGVGTAISEFGTGAAMGAIKEGSVGQEALLGGALSVAGAGAGKLLGSAITGVKNFKFGSVGEKNLNLIKSAVPSLDKSIVNEVLSKGDDYVTGLSKEAPMEFVGKKFTGALTKLDEIFETVGKKIGDSVDSLKGNKYVVLTQEPLDIMENLGSKNVTVDPKTLKLVFNGSDLASSSMSGDKKIIEEYWERFFMPTKKITSTGDETLVFNAVKIRDLISGIRNIGNDLYGAASQGKPFTVAEGVLEQMRQALKNQLDDYVKSSGDDALITLNKQYSEFSDVLPVIWKSIKDEGQVAGQFLRRVTSNAGGVPSDLLEKMQALAVKYGVPEGASIGDLSTLANIVEDVFGVVKQNSLAGQLQMAGKSLTSQNPTSFIDIAIKAVQGIANTVRGQPKEQLVKAIQSIYGANGKKVSQNFVTKMIKVYGGEEMLMRIATMKEKAGGFIDGVTDRYTPMDTTIKQIQ